METRHRLNFSTFEEGKLTLRDYLRRVVSTPYPEMIELLGRLKLRYGSLRSDWRERRLATVSLSRPYRGRCFRRPV